MTVISWFKKFSLQFSVCILDNVLLSMYQRRALDNTRSLYIFLTQSPSFRQDIVIATKTDINMVHCIGIQFFSVLILNYPLLSC